MKEPFGSMLAAALAAALVATPAAAQWCGGGGDAALATTTLAAGGTVTLTLSGDPGAAFVLALSGSAALTPVPGLGAICLDLASPDFAPILALTLDASGTFPVPFAVPDTPFWRDVVFFLQGVAADASQPLGLALTNALRQDYEPGDSWTQVPSLAAPRTYPAAATIPEQGWVLVAGGGSASTEVYFPLARAAGPGPSMSVARSLPTMTTLPDGRVLVAGGASGTTALASCEIFDPEAYAFVPAAPMGTPRYDHRAVLLDDGRVLVVGGSLSADYGVFSVMNTVSPYLQMGHATGEIYDPATDAWTPVSGSMQSPRVAPGAAKLGDGRVLIASGWNGSFAIVIGPYPTSTATCDLFDPATASFVPAPPLPPGVPARGRSAATTLPSGSVFIAGGELAGLAFVVTATTALFDGAAWMQGPDLLEPRVEHGQALLPGGSVFIGGGRSLPGQISTQCMVFDGAAVLPVAPMPTARHGYALATLLDGSLLAVGGVPPAPVAASDEIHLYTPMP